MQSETMDKKELEAMAKEMAKGVKTEADLAGLYHAQRRYDEAEPLYQRALAIRKKTLGPGHPHTATTLNNLEQLYRAEGRNEEAERLLREHGQ